MDELAVQGMARVFGGKTWRTLGFLLLCALGAYLVPGLARFRPVRVGAMKGLVPATRILVWKEGGEPIAPPALRPLALPDAFDAQAVLRRVETLDPSRPAPVAIPYVIAPERSYSGIFGSGSIEDPAGSMAHFYQSLERTRLLQPGAVTRILHLGDSPIVGDLISGGARERLQRGYGDAGHGWTMPSRPWDWYYHFGVNLDARGWRARSPLFGNGGAGRCGLNGVCFVSASPSAWARIGTVSRGLGSAVSHFWVYFGTAPGGGTLLASVDGEPPMEIPTGSPSGATASQDIPVPDGRHALTLKPKGDGEVTLYGVALERESPGVIYDSVGTSGGTVRFLTLLDASDWEASLRWRRPDLVILNYGTNESTWEGLGMAAHANQCREVVASVRRAVPDASILIMAPMDRGTRDGSGRIVTLASIPRLVGTQRAVAAETGCAFFNTYEAMGGEGAMERWYHRESPLVSGDLTHPTNSGADLISKLLVDALERGFSDHLNAQVDPITREPSSPVPSP